MDFSAWLWGWNVRVNGIRLLFAFWDVCSAVCSAFCKHGIDWDQNQSDLSDLTLSVRRVTGSPWIPVLDLERGRDSWCWPKGALPLGTGMLSVVFHFDLVHAHKLNYFFAIARYQFFSYLFSPFSQPFCSRYLLLFIFFLPGVKCCWVNRISDGTNSFLTNPNILRLSEEWSTACEGEITFQESENILGSFQTGGNDGIPI